ncbi:MAG TPA: nitroreductase family protein [Bacillota bacterium]|nr:nitroreductase family protein [Bacillota bacterium]
MNDTLKTIAGRYSCRSYTDQLPEDEKLMAIAQAGIQAPSGMNRQGWQVIVVKDKNLIDEMEAEGMKILSGMGDKSMYERIMARGGKLFYNAPCMIVVAIKEAFPKGAELIDCGILAQNIVLAATSLGIANLHCGFVGLAFAGGKAADFKRRLKFPEGYECGMGVLLGYAANTAEPHLPDQEKITVIE